MKRFSAPLVLMLLVALLVPGACQSTDTLSSAGSEDAGQKQGRAVLNGPLKPFRDTLFAYRAPLESRDGGDYLRVPFDEARDVNGRDELPVRKAKAQYISRLPAASVGRLAWTAEGRSLAGHVAGRIDGNARYTVIYLHGRDGNADWGFDDERFGGNFSRAKTLMAENGGAWLSPDFTNFEAEGAADIAALIGERAARGAGRIVLACGSLGTKLCWSLANNADTRNQLAGLVLLGGFSDRDFLRVAYSGAFADLPVYIAHGSSDSVYDVADVEDLYGALRAKGLPVRMTVFETGGHGTPVRMIDWRQALNWIFSQ